MNFLNKAVTVCDSSNFEENKDVRIIGCEGSYIYLAINVDCLQVSSCVNCTVFVAAAARCVTLDKCENVHITAASSFIRVGNCVDCTIHSYSHMSPPVIFGDTRSLTVAPHNASYPDLTKHLRQAGINWKSQVKNIKTEDRINQFVKPILMRVPK